MVRIKKLYPKQGGGFLVYREQIRRFQPSCEQEERDKANILAYCAYGEDLHDVPNGEGAFDPLTRDNRMYHLTSSGLILNPSRDKILMVLHNIYQTWTWTGGHVDGERDLEAVAIREAREETGLHHVKMLYQEIASLDSIHVPGHRKNGAYVSVHLHLNAAYLLEASEEETLEIKADENSGVQWIPLDQVAMRSGEADIVSIYQKMLRRLGLALP